MNSGSLPQINNASLICGDFNSRSTHWGYKNTNPNGSAVISWAEAQDFHLLYDSKEPPTFFSGRHKNWYNPDLAFVPSTSAHTWERTVLNQFPKSGHCPIILKGSANITIKSLNKKRWNFRKADWEKFTSKTNDLTKDLPDPKSNKSAAYSAFTVMLNSAAKASIPRGRRGNYIPCWDDECDAALNDVNKADPMDRAAKNDHLYDILGEKRKARWEESIASIDFTHSSRKAWATVNRLTDRSATVKKCPVSANEIASVLVQNGKWQRTATKEKIKEEQDNINTEIKATAHKQPASSPLSDAISVNELLDAIFCLKNGKAPGIDKVHAEFLRYLGLRAVEWLRCFLSDCLESTTIPSIWKQAKVIAILKPKKPEVDPTSYCPISLLRSPSS